MEMKWFRFLIPWFSPRFLLGMLGVSICGAVVAGIYGVIHDQFTYTISEEYFTRFKFHQFAYAEPAGDSPRLFAGIIGFLASWWVGALVGWIFARVSIGRDQRLPSHREVAIFFLIVFSTAATFAFGGWGWGAWRKSTGYAQGWRDWMDASGVIDIESFMTVGYIHNASYMGGIIGTLFALTWLLIIRRRNRLSFDQS